MMMKFTSLPASVKLQLCGMEASAGEKPPDASRTLVSRTALIDSVDIMGDSWEDIATPLPNKEEKSTKGSGLNPNAPSFSFSPGATSFVPSKVAQPPAGFTMPTYPPPSGGKVLDSPPPAASQASAPQPTAEPKELSPTSAASRGQGDAQPQSSESQQGRLQQCIVLPCILHPN